MAERLRALLTPAIVLAALVGVALLLRHEGPVAARALARADAVPLLLAALAANVGGLVLAVHAWRVLVPAPPGSAPGTPGPVRGLLAARIYFLGQLSKYLPGRVWGVVTHVTHGRAVGVPAAAMTSAYLLSLALTVLTGACVSLFAAPAVLPGQWFWLVLPVLGLLACLARPALATGPVVALARLARRTVEPPPEAAVRRAIALAVASWLVSGLHLWFLAVALGAPAVSSAGPGIGAFALATVVSSLAVVVPDGWGVRELTIAAALATALPGGTAATAAVASRVVCVVAELGSSAVVLALARARLGPPGTRTAAGSTTISTPAPAPAPAPAPTPIGDSRVHP
ncbi:lysylphosphatidylglycerol synthase domain-containing protein [Kitasatospora purpeofusca]|uniref:lysylphosphatidylglycerol synthase domain-containing protein n=1 Tax=Kitasatospora purpeofusca TaxID=67352 RepID=UPI0022571FB5|nr:lysylphosphatidylglycerol synthase domain-containing protein [Kitasatospora purpeofusca]MCX4683873.1 lysylphosphatidylglycerol synthase domain-containing protein [Kitasatospora purpeofusca]